MANSLQDQIFQIISRKEPITTREIQEALQEFGVSVQKDEINSILYSGLRNSVIRDVNAKGIPAWRVRRKQFSAAGGLEAKLYQALLKANIITTDTAHLGYGVKNTHNGKSYHLDIAVFLNDNKYDIEIDGFDHVRADALSSLERQIKEGGKHAQIEIDWMDNEKSFISYSEIDTKTVYQWLGNHIDWCIRYHEELLWPKDITRNIWLIEKGWKVIRFWNGEVSQNLNRCIKDIKEWLEK